MPICPPSLDLDCQRDDLDLARLRAVGEDVARRLATTLEIETPMEVRVIVGEGPDEAVGDVVRVSPRTGRGLSLEDAYAMLLAHELTHVLVRRAWGRPPVLFWEGLPVHLGDDTVRTRVLGRTYAAYCRILLDLHAAIPLEALMTARAYYCRRPDVRVDLTAGALCGFLLRTRGAAAVRAFIRAVEPPRPSAPRWVVTPAMEGHLGGDLPTLEREWHASLRALPDPEPSLRSAWARRDFAASPKGRLHCNACFGPMGQGVCEGCGAWALDVEVS